jgi:hypothetical protein
VGFDLHFVFFMARDGEHFFMCFLTICTSSFEKVLINLPGAEGERGKG